MKNSPFRVVALHLNGAVVIDNDSIDDGQPQAGAALFGGEVGQKQFIDIFRRNT